MIIRTMNVEDLDQICQIETAIFSHPWSRESFESSMLDPHNQYLVVEIEGKILGYCGLWGVLEEGQITNVAVRDEYRNQGIGKCMLEKLLVVGRGMGLTTFTLEVRVSNSSAIQLYHSLGFQDVGIRKNFYESPIEDAWIMWL